MKIIFFTNSFFPQIGGVEWSVYKTAEALQRLGHLVIIISEKKHSSDEDHFQLIMNFKVIRFSVPTIRPFTKLLIWKWMFNQQIVFNDADVLHFHDYGTFIFWFLPLKIFFRKAKYVITHHGFDSYPIKLKDRFFRWIADRNMDYHFGVGEYLTKYYSTRFDYLFTGAPTRDFKVESLSKRGNILFLGRLNFDTGFEDYIKVLSDIAKTSQIKLSFRICGEGPLKENIRIYRSTNLKVEYLGKIFQIEQQLKWADIICASSYLSIFDAMNAGRCVVIYLTSDFKHDYIFSIQGIDQCSFIAHSHTELADNFYLALNDHEMRQTKILNSQKLLETLSWNKITEDHLKFYYR